MDKFVKKLTGNSKSNPVLRLKTLSTIYNVLGGNGTARYTFFFFITLGLEISDTKVYEP